MAAIERRAKKTKPEAEAPISRDSRDERDGRDGRDTLPAPPMSATIASGIAVHDTIPTPPPSPNDEVDDVEIPTLRGLDLERGIAEAGENLEETKALSEQ